MKIKMRGLRDFKVPDFKFPKFKMKDISEIEEMNINYDEIEKNKDKKKDKKEFVATNYNSIKEIFEHSIKTYANKEFILEKFDPKGKYEEISYEQFGKDVIGFGTALNRVLKLENRPRIMILSETTYDWYVSYVTLLCGDAIAIPTDKELPENELENVVKRSKADAIIYSEKKADSVKKIMEKFPQVKYFIKMYSEDGLQNKTVGMQYLINEGTKFVNSGDDYFAKVETDPDEFKVLLFTSGTTSNAKGVMLTSRNLAENINAATAYAKVYPEDRFFSVLPLHHTYESTIGFLLPMAWGSSIAVCQGLKHIVPNMLESKPSVLISVPLLIENLYKKINASIKKAGKDGLVGSMLHITNALKMVGVDVKRKVFSDIYENLGGNLRFIVSAAAPIDAKIGKWVEDIGITFLQGYGLTETAPIAALTPEYQPKVGSAGKAIPKGEIRIEDPNEDGEGEVLIKTPTLMIGYYEDEKATNEVIEVIDGERWFHSGDIGYLDKDGFLYITGRSKNVIVTQNGKNIYPEEIELLLAQVPEIKECMVYGKQDEKDPSNKELIISVKVIPNLDKIGENLTDEEIREIIWPKIKEVNKKLTSYKAIKNLEIKHDEFEKTTTMKIKRYAEIKKSK
ncbi:MAG: AMP-binding protein [Clostridia bacterium]|jgi:long-chain acyl-CoA synthetase|nr:AMP-binding protein [Clostridia bacterium]